MNNRALVTLLLAGALAVPVMAQQTDNSSQTTSQPAATQSQPSADQNATSTQQPATQSSTDQNATTGASGKQPLQAQTHEGFWGHLNPFARKKYVQRQTQPIRDRINELDELTANNSKMIKDVDSRAQQGIQLASNKANEADQHAFDAGNRATQAQQTAQQAHTRLQTVEQVVTNIDQYKPTTQTEIRFRPGQTVLSKKAKEALDDMAGNLKGQRVYIVQVQGFSSERGQAAIGTSQKMDHSVVRYLALN
ncbi:MAG: hypothetical protein ACM3MF_09550, partial [Anaerolineae bacterium]